MEAIGFTLSAEIKMAAISLMKHELVNVMPWEMFHWMGNAVGLIWAVKINLREMNLVDFQPFSSLALSSLKLLG